MATVTTQPQTETIQNLPACENRYINPRDPTREEVFCNRANDWIPRSCCGKCGPEMRVRMPYEW
jgi:hypothetical protein